MKKIKRAIIIFVVIIIILVTFGLIRQRIIKKQEDTRPLNSLADLKNPKDVMRYCGGEYLGEKESTDDKYKLDIYVKFNVDLYTGEKSNEEYYRKVARTMAYVLKFESFRLADEDKKILIAVECNSEDKKIETTYINGYINYFARQNSEIQYENMSNTKITELNIQAPELIRLINNNWRKNTLNLGEGQEYNNRIIYSNGIYIKNTYKTVFNIVFSDNYTENVVNNINTQMSLNDIIAILGNPAFDDRENSGVIGYKGNDIYVFFERGQISVYPIQEYDTTSFVDLVKEFASTTDVKKFCSSLTSLWPDYDSYNYGEQLVDLAYSLKGIKVQFNVTDKHGIIVYNNYCGSIEELKKIQEDTGLEELYFVDENSVYLAEIDNVKQLTDATP